MKVLWLSRNSLIAILEILVRCSPIRGLYEFEFMYSVYDRTVKFCRNISSLFFASLRRLAVFVQSFALPKNYRYIFILRFYETIYFARKIEQGGKLRVI